MRNHESIHTFIYPDIHSDVSLTVLSPNEKQSIEAAVITAREKIRTIAVRTIDDLIQTVVTDEAVMWASLISGYFGKLNSVPFGISNSGRIIQFLLENHESRFWQVMDQYIYNGEKTHQLKELLVTRIRFHIHCQAYPQDFGRRLLQWVYSLPPAVRRFKELFPLLSMSECLRLGQFAKELDLPDVRRLIEAAAGDRIEKNMEFEYPTNSLPPSIPQSIEATLNLILNEISELNLAQRIGRPVDLARASFALEHVIVHSAHEFYQILDAFYLHLLRYTRSLNAPADAEEVHTESLALLERAFASRAGVNAALAEARDGVRGGMRYVLDLLTEQCKREEQEKYIHRILKEALDPLDWDSKVDLTAALLQRLAYHLPPEIRSAPPERFTAHYETLVQVYVQSFDKLKEQLRTW